MTTDAIVLEKAKRTYSSKTLNFAAVTWFVVATAGQWLFGIYILLFYGKSTLTGNFERWNQVLPHGYVAGDWTGNLVVGVHVLFAVILVIGGPLQLIPQVRERFRTFHRRLGKAYVLTAIVVSLAGLLMVWTRGSVGDTTMHVSISIQAVYIILFACLSIRYAKTRQLEKHRNWTLRLFMVVNGVWFFRVGLMGWLVIHGGPVGFDPKTFTGPFLTALSVFIYAIPVSLIVLEMYLYAQRMPNKLVRLLTATLILLITVVMSVGIFGATMGLWLPRL